MLKFLRRERDGVIALLLHALVPNEQAIASSGLMPYQAVTVGSTRKMIEYFLAHGYQSTTCKAIEHGISEGKHFLLTFDDGYANNELIVPLLEEYKIDAAVFVSTHHIETGNGFWWDAHYRACTAKGMNENAIMKERGSLKPMLPGNIAEMLRSTYGNDVLRPSGELDRPFTIAEVKKLAAHPRITIGNHTHHHTLLALCKPDEARKEIHDAQELLTEWTNDSPTAIAYPNGAYSPAIEAMAQDEGLRLGITTERRKNKLPAGGTHSSAMHLSRFAFHEAIMNEKHWKRCRFDTWR